MKKFLVTFYDGPNSSNQAQEVIDAIDTDNAFSKAYKSYNAQRYSSVSVEELTYLDKTNGKFFVQFEVERDVKYASGIRLVGDRKIMLALAPTIRDAKVWYMNHKCNTEETTENGAKIYWLGIKDAYIMGGSYEWLSNREHIKIGEESIS